MATLILESFMQNLIDIILSKPIYMIIVGVATSILLFLLVKKLFKFFAYAVIVFIAFLAYLHFTGSSVTNAIKDVKDKGEEIINKKD
jgi:hypothetical protein